MTATILGNRFEAPDEIFVQDAQFGDVLIVDFSRQQDGRDAGKYLILGSHPKGKMAVNLASRASTRIPFTHRSLGKVVGKLVSQESRESLEQIDWLRDRLPATVLGNRFEAPGSLGKNYPGRAEMLKMSKRDIPPVGQEISVEEGRATNGSTARGIHSRRR